MRTRSVTLPGAGALVAIVAGIALWPAASHAAWYRWHHCGAAAAWRGDGGEVPPVVAERLATCRTLLGERRDALAARFGGAGEQALDTSYDDGGSGVVYPVRLDPDSVNPVKRLIVHLSAGGSVVDVYPELLSA